MPEGKYELCGYLHGVGDQANYFKHYWMYARRINNVMIDMNIL